MDVMSKITMTAAPKMIPQLGIWMPAMDVFWLNHSIAFSPGWAALVGDLVIVHAVAANDRPAPSRRAPQ
jgi:hypothetical protein